MVTPAVPNRSIRVSIATTQGPAEVAGLESLGGRIGFDGFRSMINLQGGGTNGEILGPGAVPNSYNDFVRLETGVVERLFGRGPYVMELTRDITGGESWQAGVLLAHAAHAQQRLATRHGGDSRFGIAAWVTGLVDRRDFSLRKVDHLSEKLARSIDYFTRLADRGMRVIAFFPTENVPDAESLAGTLRDQLSAAAVELAAVASVGEMLQRLDLRGTEHHSPFRGLFRFEPEDRALFFGRREAAAQAIRRLREGFGAGRPFLLISGQSGVGKSSLARAGILGHRHLFDEAADRAIAIVDLQEASGSPRAALADQLVAALPRLATGGDDAAGLARLEPACIARKVQAALDDGKAAPPRLLLLVDQLERLFTGNAAISSEPGEGAETRELFAETLAALVASGLVWIIATIRSEFLAKIDEVPALRDLANGRDYVLRPPRRDELQEMIEEPMKLWGLTAGSDPEGRSLIEVLLDAAVKGPGSLPLLEYTLDELVRQHATEASTDRVLSFEAYARLGGLTGIIGRRVDEELKSLGGMELQRPGVEALIRSLAHIDFQSGKPVARQTPVADILGIAGLDPRLIELLDRLRLVLRDGPVMRVAHEALLTEWKIAREVLDRDARDVLLRDQLFERSLQWQNEKQPENRVSLLLPAGKPLSDAADLVQRRRSELSEAVITYVDASETEARRRRGIAIARLAADEQRSLDHIRSREFAAAERELQNIAAYLNAHEQPDLAARAPEFAARWERMRRLAGFFGAAREAERLAGEESFDEALPKCREALAHLDIEDAHWLDKLPIQDIAGDAEQLGDLEQEAYRTLLLYSALQLVPGIRALPPPASKRGARLMAFAEPVLPHVIAVFGRFFLHRLATKGGLGPIRLPARMDCREALAEFAKIQTALSKISDMERRFAAQSPDDTRAASRSSQFVQRLVAFFVELASPPLDAAIDYRRWLLGGWQGPPPDPINAADYFFIGLLNYFIAKRRQAWIPKALALVKGQFPDIDGKAPVATADRLLRAAIALEPRNFWAHWVLGRNLLTAGDYAGAELAFNAAIALRPHYARGYEQRALAIAHRWAAARDKDARLRDRALEDSAHARRLADADPSIFWPRGELFERLGDLSAALRSYARWLELEQDIPSLIARASGLDDLDRLTTRLIGAPAVPIPTPARRAALKADALAVRAHVRLIRKSPQRALRDANEALELSPHQTNALTARGMALLRSGCGIGAALESLQHAIERAAASGEPNYRALFERAKAREEAAGDAAALAAWQELVAASAASACERCPRWMLVQAREAQARLAGVPATP